MPTPFETIASIAVFCGEFLSTPRTIGSLIPSSNLLARHIANRVPDTQEGYVVELGAGTGAITEALLKYTVPATRLICVERSPNMVRLLRRRFEGVRIFEADAAHLGELLAGLQNTGAAVSHVISSLPMRSLEPELVGTISKQIHQCLPPDGHLIQFTYALGDPGKRAPAGFRRIATSRVWVNLPPARVDVFMPNAPPVYDGAQRPSQIQ